MTIRTLTAASLLSLATAIATPALAQQAPIVQPGAPGAESRTLKAEDATKLADTAFSPADVMFMQMMIPHHAQALELTELVEGRTSNPDMLKIAGRIEELKSRIRIALPSAYPYRPALLSMAGRIQAQGP